jgi:hypothetical protein
MQLVYYFRNWLQNATGANLLQTTGTLLTIKK